MTKHEDSPLLKIWEQLGLLVFLIILPILLIVCVPFSLMKKIKKNNDNDASDFVFCIC